MTLFWDLGRFADRPALVEDGRTVSYAELDALARGFERNLEPRSLVFLAAENTSRSIAAYLGCLVGGHVVHLYSPKDRERLDGLIERYRPNVLVEDGTPVRLCAERHTLHPELRVLLGTSGTTGSPKLVKLSARNIDSNAAAIVSHLGLAADDRAITSLKFAHAFGMSVVNSHLAAGASLLLTDHSTMDSEFWALCEAGGATSFAGVPYTFEMLRRQSDGWARIPSLRHVAQAGGRLDPDFVRHFAGLGARCGWKFFVMYGQTEASPRMAYLPPELAAHRADCIGRPIPGGEIRLIDERGGPVGEGESGELAYLGPNVMMGYAEGLQHLSIDETPPLLRTGDIAVREADGLFRIVGRKARFVKPFGVRLNLDDVQAEARILSEGALAAPDGERVLIALLSGDAALARRLRERLAQRYGLPASVFRSVEIDEVPLLHNGKVDYHALTAAHARSPADGRQRSFLSIVVSFDFVRIFLREAARLLGLAPLTFASVAHIYADVLKRTSVDGEDTFTDLAGDSLSYVEAHMGLEAYLGHAPEGWESMTVDQLESLRRHAVVV